MIQRNVNLKPMTWCTLIHLCNTPIMYTEQNVLVALLTLAMDELVVVLVVVVVVVVAAAAVAVAVEVVVVEVIVVVW